MWHECKIVWFQEAFPSNVYAVETIISLRYRVADRLKILWFCHIPKNKRNRPELPVLTYKDF